MGIENLMAFGEKISVRNALSQIGFQPSKGRGQNFLSDEGISRKIVESPSLTFNTAFEIGPGLGALTSHLVDSGKKVIAVEIDRRLADWIRSENFNLLRDDALKLDWNEVLSDSPEPRVLFSNLPYSIGGLMIEKMCMNSALFSQAILCVQTEVADRILSDGGRSMGPLTLLAHRFFEPRERLFRVQPGSFHPRPKVTSTVIRLTFRPGVKWTEKDRRIPRILFRHRRKKLKAVIAECGVSDRVQPDLGSQRIDQLSVYQAAELFDLIRESPAS